MAVIIFFIFILLMILGYAAGSVNEKNHYRSIKEREKKTLHLPVVNMKKVEDFMEPRKQIASAELVIGSVVVSIDFFKLILASLRNIVGGNVRSYETLVDRGRREAILRMKEAADSPDIIMNLRIETSTIGKSPGSGSIGSIEVLAYGTAIRYKY